jgi:anti-anti-sigma factor
MEVTITADGDSRYIITCPQHMEWNARIDLVEALKAATKDQPPRTVIVDLADVNYINSAGLGAIFALRKFVEQAGGAIAVARPNVTIARLLRTVNLAALMPVTDSLEQARASLPASNPVA